ncbi:cobalt-precorrin-6A reductase [Hyphomicrobium sp.]|uniref:cobalt-precorrin-6A reductase n=1 Tax=Hyphomicrobium sp. TaxID=82 RepID=UPI002D785A17|nr:cobalt-precorrin-6A reductase [Hyphomicrobium sp.]HET6389039.1 cobalt-precorrin-6A reductase [Hyphomicrobium sp.]
MITKPDSPLRVLLLGGTTEAAALARALADDKRLAATLSLAGRTANPVASPLPVRIGGFGGVDGLSAYLAHARIDLVIDATHPFAARMSANAISAAAAVGIPLLAIERPPWTRTGGDDWIEYDSIEAAIAGLPAAPQNVFSALGRQAIPALSKAPQHRYLIRVVDASDAPANLPHATMIAARGPFRAEDDIELFSRHGIRHVLAKNAGGNAAYAKIEAARKLGIKVHMVRRPAIAARETVTSVEAALAWITRHHQLRSERGV